MKVIEHLNLVTKILPYNITKKVCLFNFVTFYNAIYIQ